MSISKLLNQFLGGDGPSSHANQTHNGSGVVSSLANKLPSGLAGGAAAGGVMALLAGNKSARKFAGKAARYGGAALLGGLAFSAYRKWQTQQQPSQANPAQSPQVATSQPDAYAYQAIEKSFKSESVYTENFQLTLVQAMISAAKADGHIDNKEQTRIFNAIEQMDLSHEAKGVIFDLMRQPISVTDIANGAHCIEQKSGVYLASCLAVDLDGPIEQAYLNRLATALALPDELASQLRDQADQAFKTAA
ncbi:tellurite resistance TerB family protein [Neiella sp. HB171785]|uniref:Tellurite resistance TerB family protein n=1 Tax=Neiella litorisoli TaxID=2771431 RepID=A0A8J6UJK8_9GAMM|nr:tellurite resistance TerB family protein [Neiella litorisoli]MBD1390783.1 tellurite resistance TerB family protein [Neiella litorisoli]